MLAVPQDYIHWLDSKYNVHFQNIQQSATENSHTRTARQHRFISTFPNEPWLKH